MIALSTGSLYNYSVERVFALARQVGFDGIEVLVDHRWETRQADYLRALAKAYGLPVLSLHTPFVFDIQGWEVDRVLRIQRTVALARLLGARTVVAHLPFRYHWLSVTSTLLNSRLRLPIFWPQGQAYAQWLLQCLNDSPGEDEVQVVVENMPARRVLGLRLNPWRFNNLQDLLRFKALVLDTTHLGTWNMDILAAYQHLKSRIVHLHLSDYDGREHRLPRQGHLPLAELLRRMAMDGYCGLIVVETCPQALGAGEDARVQRGLSEALSFCRKYFASA
jgi:sugar phosphate isomerase/epimerase